MKDPNTQAFTYLSTGYDKFMSRESSLYGAYPRQQLTTDDVNNLLQGISGSKITSGTSKSTDGNFSVNWDSGLLSLFDGTQAVVQIGAFSDGTKGIRVLNSPANNFQMSYLELDMPSSIVTAGRPNSARLYVDNGAVQGKNRLMVQFNTEAPHVIYSQ